MRYFEAVLIVLLVAFLGWLVYSERGVHCISKPDGSVYCLAPDGHIYRQRAEKFRVIQ